MGADMGIEQDAARYSDGAVERVDARLDGVFGARPWACCRLLFDEYFDQLEMVKQLGIAP